MTKKELTNLERLAPHVKIIRDLGKSLEQDHAFTVVSLDGYMDNGIISNEDINIAMKRHKREEPKCHECELIKNAKRE